ncbi:hypothetical protein Sjap_019157 [Stephania japonica]|uniref:Pentatricopeptide repeat-containing protein n=1 Tax=Stephania japonica TaxID=461633 RepID=A0AAP0F5G2_9MAGN
MNARTSSRSNVDESLTGSESVSVIAEVVAKDGDDLEELLDRVFQSLNLSVISETFRISNSNRVSGVRFFRWVCERRSGLSRSSKLCSLVIDNVGAVGDYESMLVLLKEFSEKKICLTEKAFGFLSVCIRDHELGSCAVKRVVDMLNSVGGSCRNSGVHALIKMLCIADAFPLTMYVMELTERRTSYYNILIWAQCRGGNFQEAHDLIDVMKKFNCEPNANSYNYIFSSLCKNKWTVDASNLLEDMEELGFLPDEITFEVVICHLCRLGQLDLAAEYLKHMMSKGLEPRLTTHAIFIKGYFYGNRLQEAYRYVVDAGDKQRCSENMNYSLLASLFQRSRRVVEARQVLNDMIGRGLRPNFSVYMKVMKDLHRLGMGDMAVDLKSRFMKLDASN